MRWPAKFYSVPTLEMFEFIILSIYLFLALLSLCCTWAFSSCVKPGHSSCGVRASHCGGLSCCQARALGTPASGAGPCGLRSCSSWAQEHRLNSCGAQAQLPHGRQNLSGLAIKPLSPALADSSLLDYQGSPKVLNL